MQIPLGKCFKLFNDAHWKMKSVSSVLVRVSPIQSRINVSLANAVILCSAGRNCRATGGVRAAVGASWRKQLRYRRALIVFKYNAIKMKVQIMLHQHQRQQYNQPTAGTYQQVSGQKRGRSGGFPWCPASWPGAGVAVMASRAVA